MPNIDFEYIEKVLADQRKFAEKVYADLDKEERSLDYLKQQSDLIQYHLSNQLLRLNQCNRKVGAIAFFYYFLLGLIVTIFIFLFFYGFN